MNRLVLTDDEVVALAVLAEAFWPAPLTTVDITARHELLAAALRGKRSLLVRDLLRRDSDRDVLDETLLDIAAPILGAQRALRVYLGNEELDAVGDGGIFVLYPPSDDGDWRLEQVSADGVHEISRLPVDAARELVRSLALAATSTQESPEDSNGVVRLVCAANVGDGALIARVGPRGVQWLSRIGDGFLTRAETAASGDNGSEVFVELVTYLGTPAA